MVNIIKNEFSEVPIESLYYKHKCTCGKWLAFTLIDCEIIGYRKYIKCPNCYLKDEISGLIEEHDKHYRRYL